MSRAQYEQLLGLIHTNHRNTQEDAELVRATASMDRCDGSVPESTRQWVRAMDGWATETVSDNFMLKLAKATTTGDLQEEVRRWTNGPVDTVDTWPSLRPRILEHFLSACETVRLQTQLEALRQRMGEATPAYIRRFRSEAARAYSGTDRAPSEESRVVAAFLRGLLTAPSPSESSVQAGPQNSRTQWPLL